MHRAKPIASAAACEKYHEKAFELTPEHGEGPSGQTVPAYLLGSGLPYAGLEEGQRLDRETFHDLLTGRVFNAVTGQHQQLGRNIAGPDGEIHHAHNPGIEFSVSPPKSCQVMGETVDPRLHAVQALALKNSFAAMEKMAGIARVSIDGEKHDVNFGNLIAAAFPHHTVRLGNDPSHREDPGSHTHLCVMGAVFDPHAGKFRSLNNRELISAVMTWDKCYLNEYRRLVHELGYETYNTDKGWEIKGFSREQVEHFSTRMMDAKAEAAQRGIDFDNASAAGKTQAVLNSRNDKTETTAHELRPEWESRAAAIGLDLHQILAQAHERAQTYQTQPGHVVAAAAEHHLGTVLAASAGKPLKMDQLVSAVLDAAEARTSTAAVLGAISKAVGDGDLHRMHNGMLTTDKATSERITQAAAPANTTVKMMQAAHMLAEKLKVDAPDYNDPKAVREFLNAHAKKQIGKPGLAGIDLRDYAQQAPSVGVGADDKAVSLDLKFHGSISLTLAAADEATAAKLRTALHEVNQEWVGKVAERYGINGGPAITSFFREPAYAQGADGKRQTLLAGWHNELATPDKVDLDRLRHDSLALGAEANAMLAGKLREMGFALENYVDKRNQEQVGIKGYTDGEIHKLTGDGGRLKHQATASLSTGWTEHEQMGEVTFKNAVKNQAITYDKARSDGKTPYARRREFEADDARLLEKLSERQPQFSAVDLRAAVYREAAWDPTGKAMKEADARVARILASDNVLAVDPAKMETVPGRGRDQGPMFVDRALVMQELQLQKDLHRMADTAHSAPLSQDKRLDIIREIEARKGVGFKFRADQKDTILKATDGKGFFAINALAGTGKTTSLEAILEIQKAQGKNVLLVSPWNKAVTQMAADTKTERNKEAFTVDKLARGIAKGELSINKNTVLIMDEAGLASHKEMRALTEIAKTYGCALGAQGDKDQTAAVSHGDPFRNYVETRNAAMGVKTDVASLTEVTRQNLQSQKDATVAAAAGDFGKVLGVYQGEKDIRAKLDGLRNDLLSGFAPETAFRRATGKDEGQVTQHALAKALQDAGVIDKGVASKLEKGLTLDRLAGALADGKSERAAFEHATGKDGAQVEKDGLAKTLVDAKLITAKEAQNLDKTMAENSLPKVLDKLVDAHRSTVQTQFKGQDELIGKVAQDFLAAKAGLPDKIAIATTNASVDALNSGIRAGLVEQGKLGESRTYKTASDGRIELAAGDRICLNSKATLPVDGGKKFETRTIGDKSEFGTVLETTEKGILLRMDGQTPDGKDRAAEFLPTSRMPDLQHGYAATTSKLQGSTVKEAFYAHGSFSNSALAYVSLSRHKEALHIYALDKDAKDMAASMAQKDVKPRAAELVSDHDLGKVKADMAAGVTAEKVLQAQAQDKTASRDVLTELAKPSKAQEQKQNDWAAKREAFQERKYGVKLLKDHGLGRGFTRVSLSPVSLVGMAVAEMRIPVVSDFAKRRLVSRVRVGKVATLALRTGQAAIFSVKATAAISVVAARGIAAATNKASVMLRTHQAAKTIAATRKRAHDRIYSNPENKVMSYDHAHTARAGKEQGFAARSQGQSAEAGNRKHDKAPEKTIAPRAEVKSMSAAGGKVEPKMPAEQAAQKLNQIGKDLAVAVKAGDVKTAGKLQAESKAILVDQAKGGAQRVADVKQAASKGDYNKLRSQYPEQSKAQPEKAKEQTKSQAQDKPQTKAKEQEQQRRPTISR